MRKILVCSANRSERGLLETVKAELDKRSDVEAYWHDVLNVKLPHIQDSIWSFQKSLLNYNPSIILIPTDRWEMVYLAAYAFHDGYVVAHFHAGNPSTDHPDDMNRRAISCFSHIMFSNEESHRQNLIKLGEESWRIFTCGSTAFDDIEIDESLCPKESYDLVLLHPDPISLEATTKDLIDTVQAIENSENVIWLYPNRDRNYEVIVEAIKRLQIKSIHIIPENLARPKFLGLLANCKRAVGNSSSFFWELPRLNSKAEVIRIGHRNCALPSLTKPQVGASAKIAEILATIPIDDKLRRKKLIL